MKGTIVNCAAILVGGLAGLLLKRGIKEKYVDSITRSLGLAVLVIGFNGIVTNMFTAEGTKLTSKGELLLVVFLVVGTFIGEILRLDERFTAFSERVDKKFPDGGFSRGFINGTLLFCIGAMAIIGPINDGLTGDSSVLYVKSLLDGISSVVFGATMGFGVLFAAIPVLIYQGGITLLASCLENVLTGELLTLICTVGYAIIIAIGFNFILQKKFKTLNILPSILLPIVYIGVKALIEKI